MNNKIQLKPLMYDKFECIGGACTMTCCQQWKIAVDDITYKKWKKTPAPLAGEKKNLNFYTCMKDGQRVICLNHDKVCPFLNEERLCKVVIQYGDGMLSDTCDRYPREIHEYEDRTEYTLMPSCPAVIDLMREVPQAMKICGNSAYTLSGNLSGSFPDELLSEFSDPLALRRAFFMEIMSEKKYTPEQAFLMIFYIALDLQEKDISVWTPAARDELAAAIRQMETDPQDSFDEDCELFLDLAENYRKEELYEDFLEPLAEMVEKYLDGEAGEGPAHNGKTFEIDDKLPEFQEAWEQYTSLLRTFLLEELWADTIVPGGDEESMLMKLQWISMEYAVIRTAGFFLWEKERALSYENLRSAITVICRMTGYDEDDIREYLENSFEELIWEFGYMALILS